jgi:hypothetical protein
VPSPVSETSVCCGALLVDEHGSLSGLPPSRSQDSSCVIILQGSCWGSPHPVRLPDGLLAESHGAAGDMGWQGVAASMASGILHDKAMSWSSSFAVGNVGVAESSIAGGGDNDRERFVRSSGASRVAGITLVAADLFSVIVCGRVVAPP